MMPCELKTHSFFVEHLQEKGKKNFLFFFFFSGVILGSMLLLHSGVLGGAPLPYNPS